MRHFRERMLRSVWLGSCLILASCFAYGALATRNGRDAQSSLQLEPSALFTRPIEEIRVGDWVLARNPELTDAERAATEEVDPATWRRLSLRMRKTDGSRLDIELLRPIEWIEANAVEPGATIPLDLPEMGASGPAEVLALSPCPIPGPKPHAHSRLVTGTFAHSSAGIVDLHVDGLEQPIVCTRNHPFWSYNRHQYIKAAELRLGEDLHASSGMAARVAAMSPRADVEPVFNLEVGVEHVYYVSALGILVHNTCKNNLVRFGQDAEDVERLAREAALAESKGFPHGVSTRLTETPVKGHKNALRSEVEKHFVVEQTGRDLRHHTVHLPKPVTPETADTFNTLFPPLKQ